MKKFMKFIGGKRGLAILGGAAIAVLASFGVITPEQAQAFGGFAAVLGVGGIVHSNIKNP